MGMFDKIRKFKEKRDRAAAFKLHKKAEKAELETKRTNAKLKSMKKIVAEKKAKSKLKKLQAKEREMRYKPIKDAFSRAGKKLNKGAASNQSSKKSGKGGFRDVFSGDSGPKDVFSGSGSSKKEKKKEFRFI